MTYIQVSRYYLIYSLWCKLHMLCRQYLCLPGQPHHVIHRLPGVFDPPQAPSLLLTQVFHYKLLNGSITVKWEHSVYSLLNSSYIGLIRVKRTWFSSKLQLSKMPGKLQRDLFLVGKLGNFIVADFSTFFMFSLFCLFL